MIRPRRISLFAELLGVIAVGFCYPSFALAQTNRPSRPISSAAQKLSARQIAKRIAPSVVLLLTTDESGNPIALGSGFFVASDRLATNYHVIKDASQIFVKVAGRKRLYKISFPGLSDKQSDLARVRIDEVKGQPLKLGNLSRLRVGDEIYVMSNPEGLEGTFSRGNVSAIRNGKGLIQITAPISHGSSGGPVLDERGEVIGVAAGILSEGQNLNFAVPVSKLAPLLKPENDMLAGMSPDSATSSAPKEPLSEWQLVASSQRGNDFYISRARITPTPERTFLCWVKTVPDDSPEGRASQDRFVEELKSLSVPRSYNFSHTIDQDEFDCGHRRVRTLWSSYYGRNGVVLLSQDFSSRSDWEAVLPDSVYESLLNFACNG